MNKTSILASCILDIPNLGVDVDEKADSVRDND